jgi:hypothetical protein
MTNTRDVPLLATKGLVGWHVAGRSGPTCTYNSGPYPEVPKAKWAIDMEHVYSALPLDKAAVQIWHRPNLDLSLPDGNVRSLFEGCIGSEGTTDGHPWDGKLESLKSSDGVGLDVYIQCLIHEGGTVVRHPGKK